MLPGCSKQDEERQVSRRSSIVAGGARQARLMTLSVAAAAARVTTVQASSSYTWRSIHERSYDSSTYAGRTTSIPHHLLFMKHLHGINMSVNLRHTCLCHTIVIAGHFIDSYRL